MGETPTGDYQQGSRSLLIIKRLQRKGISSEDPSLTIINDPNGEVPRELIVEDRAWSQLMEPINSPKGGHRRITAGGRGPTMRKDVPTLRSATSGGTPT